MKEELQDINVIRVEIHGMNRVVEQKKLNRYKLESCYNIYCPSHSHDAYGHGCMRGQTKGRAWYPQDTHDCKSRKLFKKDILNKVDKPKIEINKKSKYDFMEK